MPPDLQGKHVSLSAKNKAYYDDIADFFKQYPDGIALSEFRIEFVKQYNYIPAVPSLAEFLKSCDIFTFYVEGQIDLYLLPMDRKTDPQTFKYPQNGIVLEGFPSNTRN